MDTIKFFKPEELKKLVDEGMEEIPSVDLFNNPKYQKLQEKWCAAIFGIAYEKFVRPCRIGINEILQNIDADFFLEIEGVLYTFQITEVLEEGRKRGLEYKKFESGSTQTFPYRPEKGRIEGPQWIKKAIEKKIKKKYANAKNLNLLVYVNFMFHDMQYKDMLECLQYLKDNFYSVWLMSNSAVCSLFSKPSIGAISGWRKIEL